MKIISAEFILSAPDISFCPTDALPEIALIGRSNVGKSSLINTFINRKGLAKTSSVPGKTCSINFYRINKVFYLVDLPGFGYAKVSKDVKKTWEKMTGDYIESRPNLKGAIVILDPRRDATDVERSLYKWLAETGVPALTVFTKTDKISRNMLSSRLAVIRKALPVKDPIIFSAVTGDGKAALGQAIQELLVGDALIEA